MKPEGAIKMDNPEKLSAWGTQAKNNKRKTQHNVGHYYSK
jgi:hypothetical protein